MNNKETNIYNGLGNIKLYEGEKGDPKERECVCRCVLAVFERGSKRTSSTGYMEERLE